MSEFADLSVWELLDVLQNPFGPAETPLPPGEFTATMTDREAEAEQELARAEFRRRDYSDDEITAMEEGDDSPIHQRRYPPD